MKNDSDQYSEAEAARRRDAIIRNMIATPPKKHEPLKGKSSARKRSGKTRKARPSR